MTIPMDDTSTIQAPSGPMTRARARAIQSEVTSLLLEFSPSSSETWLLPKSEILCVIRYNAQDSEPRTVEEETGVNTLDNPELPARARNFRPCLRAATWAEARVPFRHLDYIYSIPYDFLGLALV